MLIRLTEVDVYDEEEINISEFPVDDPGAWNDLQSVSQVTLLVSFTFKMEFSD